VGKEAVVADNTVLSNFALIGREDILAKLFKKRIKCAEKVCENGEGGINDWEEIRQFRREDIQVWKPRW